MTELADPAMQPPASLTSACPPPAEIAPGPLNEGPAEVLWLTDRIALADCGVRKDALAEFYRIRDAKLSGK